ncbi:MAG: DUF2784 domain-containing protein [Proteobacteria bacterium]|nr:DUF2784 domain-containing protein [Pseudomonadota bacterium]
MALLLADALVVIHTAFVAFALLGGLLALRYRWAPWLHLPALAWGAWVSLAGRVCPLTPLENALRRQAGQQGYEGGFIEHYLVPLLYPPGLTPEQQAALGAALLLVNVAVYGAVLLRARRVTRRSRVPPA